MYAVLYKEDRFEHDPYDKDGGGYRVKVDKFVDLGEDESNAINWVIKNDEHWSPVKDFKIIKYEVLTVAKTVKFNLSSQSNPGT